MTSNKSILELFEGLTESQVKELRKKIIPIVEVVRDAIVERDKGDKKNELR